MQQVHVIFSFMSKLFLSCFIFSILLSPRVFGQEAMLSDSIPFFKEDTTHYFVAPISINSGNSEYAPVINNGKLLFASDRNNLVGVVYTNENEKPLIDLFISERVDSLSFKQAKPISRTINTAFNDGPGCFNKDQSTIIFSTNSSYSSHHLNLKPQKITLKNLQLYQSDFKKNAWNKPIKLSFCKPEFSYTHPYFLIDGKTLVFSSNMAGGYGGMDLYYSIYENGSWSNPINLGAKINTAYNEVFPSVSPINMLYFSSNIPDGIGGLDLYSFDLTDSINASKHLLESPINSASDDFGAFIDSTKKQGYFSSSRNAITKDDIYYFTNKYPSIKNCVPYVAPSYCFTFYEESTVGNLSDDNQTKLIYEWDLGDGTKIKSLEARHCFKKSGTYVVELNIVEEESGALFYNEASYDFVVDDSEQVYLNAPDTAAKNGIININSYKSKIPGATILGYSWNFGDGNYSSGITGNRKYEKEGEYFIKLGVEYKNDSTGRIHELCVEKKIFIANELWKNTEDTIYTAPQNKKITFTTENVDSLNFRVYLGSSEKQIPRDADFFKGLTDIREFMLDSLYLYTAGRKEKILDLKDEYRQARANGLNSARVVAYSGDSLLQSNEKLQNVKIFDWMVNLKNNNTTFKEFSSNIYFTGFADSIQKKYLPVLDLIAEILKIESDLSISIYSFTDTVGSAEFNEQIFEEARLELSKKRGNVIKQYLEEKGIKIASIKNIPKNERPIGDENNFQKNILYNRRVTLYITKKKQ